MTEEMFFSIGFKCMDTWMSNRENQKFIYDYLEDRGIKSVGIYGYGVFGKHLYSELKNSNIEITWVADKKVMSSYENFKIHNINEIKAMKEPDVIIVSSIRYYEDIEKELKQIGFKCIRSLEEIIEVIFSWKNKR